MVFPDDWKKGNRIPVHKQNPKQIVNNNRPVSLLSFCSKIFEKLIFDDIYDFINKNNFFINSQSRVRANNSLLHHLIAIAHKCFSPFDAKFSLEVRRGVFLDLPKAFDRAWHDGLLYELKCNRIDGNLFKLITSFLNDICQRVVLNGQSSVWKSVTAGMPQCLVLGSILFIIYINDLPLSLTTNVKLIEDDTSLFSIINNASVSVSTPRNHLVKITDWAFNWKMLFNPDPTKQAKEVIFSKKQTFFWYSSFLIF